MFCTKSVLFVASVLFLASKTRATSRNLRHSHFEKVLQGVWPENSLCEAGELNSEFCNVGHLVAKHGIFSDYGSGASTCTVTVYVTENPASDERELASVADAMKYKSDVCSKEGTFTSRIRQFVDEAKSEEKIWAIALTAAHCVWSLTENEATFKDDLRVVMNPPCIGPSRVLSGYHFKTAIPKVSFDVLGYEFPANWRPETCSGGKYSNYKANDIAVLLLGKMEDHTTSGEKYTKEDLLPFYGYAPSIGSTNPFDCGNYMVAGYGQPYVKEYTTPERRAQLNSDLNSVHTLRCARMQLGPAGQGFTPPYPLESENWNAARIVGVPHGRAEGGTGTSKGDSGGPVFAYGKNMLYGTVTGGCVDADHGGKYTNVVNLVNPNEDVLAVLCHAFIAYVARTKTLIWDEQIGGVNIIQRCKKWKQEYDAAKEGPVPRITADSDCVRDIILAAKQRQAARCQRQQLLADGKFIECIVQ